MNTFKSSLLASVALLLPALLVACSEDVETTAAPAANGGSSAAGTNAGGSSAGVGGSTAGAGGSTAGAGGSTAGAGGSTAGAGGTTAGAGGATAGAGGATAGAGGSSATPEVTELSSLGHDRLFGVAFGADGAAYAVGTIADTTEATADVATIIVKLGADGKIDKAFGTGGFVRHNLAVGAGGEAARGIVVQPDGKLVVAATVEHVGAADARDRDIAVARFTAAGALDATFGASGVAILDQSAGEVAGTSYTADMAWGVGLGPDGKVLVSFAKKADGRADRDHCVLRLTTAGALDTTYGTGGVTCVDVNQQNADPRGLTVLPDGAAFAAGYTRDAAKVVSPVVYKLTKDGALDASFGVGGLYSEVVLPHTTEAYAVAMQGESLVTIGYGKAAEADALDWLSLRISKDGKLDKTYGKQGVAQVDASGFNDNGRAVAALPDGRIVLTGSGRSSADTSDAMVAVLTKDGALDATFGAGGKMIFDLGGTGDQFWAVALSPDKKRLLFVGSKGSSATHDDVAVLSLPTP